MSVACPGRCQTRGVVVAGEPVWCAACGVVVRAALRSLPTGYAALAACMGLGALTPTDAVRVSGSKARSSPSPAVDLRDEVFQVVRVWENDLRQHLGHRAGRDLETRELTLAGGVRYLNRNFGLMITRPDCAKEFGQQVNVLFSTVLRMVKNGPLRSHLGIPCPWCHRKTLMQQEGVALKPWYTACEVALGGCGRLFTEGEMEWAAQVRLAVKW